MEMEEVVEVVEEAEEEGQGTSFFGNHHQSTCHDTSLGVEARILIHTHLHTLLNRKIQPLNISTGIQSEQNDLKGVRSSWNLGSTPDSPTCDEGKLETASNLSTQWKRYESRGEGEKRRKATNCR